VDLDELPPMRHRGRGSIRMKLALVASHPIQYQAPWFAALAQQCELEVLYCHRQDAAGQAAAGFGHQFQWDIPLLDGYRFRWLDNVAPRPSVDEYSGCDTPAIGAALRDGGFDACLVTGWYLKSFIQAIRACRRYGIPLLVRGDSQLATPRSIVTRVAKYWPYRWLLSQIDAHLFVGRANYDYLRHYGVGEGRLFFAPHFVDNDRFCRVAEEARLDGRAAALRASFGIPPDEALFLFAAKLIEKKRPVDFIEAIGRLNAGGRRVHGVVVGSGPLEPMLRRQAAERRAAVHFVGFKNQSEIPVCYAAADCLILPSDGRETWGLVVNEAMACDVPAIVSDAAGCAADLIVEGRTGFTFACGDVNALCDRIDTFLACRTADTQYFAGAPARHISTYSLARAVAGTFVALHAVLPAALPQPNICAAP
jgi:glycosyltransferase involved in cell wall biosynthesis